MLYIQNHEILTFDRAVEDVHVKINNGWTSFIVNTEFGRVFFEITRDHWEPIYRYSINRWSDAPNNKYTASIIRDTSISYYVNMARVNDNVIQRMMIAMALSTVLVEYIGGRFIAGRDEIDTLTFCYMRDRNICRNDGYYPTTANLAEHYMNTISTGLFIKRQPTKDHRNLVNDFFSKRMKTAERVTKKIEESFKEHGGGHVMFAIHDDFYAKLFFLVVHEKRLNLKKGSEIYDRYKKLISDTTHIYNVPDFLKALVNGEGIEE